jgi:hypothetical protein
MNNRRTKWTVTFLVGSILLLANLRIADQFGFHYTDEALNRALVTFAVARGLNAVISVAQGTEVAIQPVGVGVNFAPGQILDPVNDLVESFSWVMLTSATSLGIQKLLLTIFSGKPFTLLLSFVALLALLVFWVSRFDSSPIRVIVVRAAAFLIVLRFTVPAFALVGEGSYALFMQHQYEQATHSLENATEQIKEVNQAAEGTGNAEESAADESVIDWVNRIYKSTVDSIDIGSYIDRYKAAATDISEQIVNLIVIFVIQTIFLPLAFLWGVLRLLRYTLHINIDLPLPRHSDR